MEEYEIEFTVKTTGFAENAKDALELAQDILIAELKAKGAETIVKNKFVPNIRKVGHGK